jgi:hypothetical protein
MKKKRERERKIELRTYNCTGVTSVRARRAVRMCCLKKKEACFLRSLKSMLPMGMERDMYAAYSVQIN